MKIASIIRKAAGTCRQYSMTCPPVFLYLRNNPTSSNKATKPANPDCPNLSIIAVRFPITFTPKTPVPKSTSDMAPTATKDIKR